MINGNKIGKKVIFIDDDHLFQNRLGFLLKKAGYQLVGGGNAGEAMRQMGNSSADIVLLAFKNGHVKKMA